MKYEREKDQNELSIKVVELNKHFIKERLEKGAER